MAAVYDFEPHQLRVLTTACESWDVAVQARQQVEVAGLTFTTRYGEVRAHPAVTIARDARLSFLRAVRELALTDGEAPDDVRPPLPAGRYQGRR